jgi:hypothetical protein
MQALRFALTVTVPYFRFLFASQNVCAAAGAVPGAAQDVHAVHRRVGDAGGGPARPGHVRRAHAPRPGPGRPPRRIRQPRRRLRPQRV